MQHSRLFQKQQDTLWRQKGGVICFNVTSDGKTGPQWVEHFEEAGHDCSDWADVLGSKDFVSTDGVTYEIVILKGAIWSEYHYRTIKNIRNDAKDFNLVEPNAEVACLILEKFSIEDLWQMKIGCIITMHKPIDSTEEQGLILGIFTDSDFEMMYTNAIHGHPSVRFPRSYGFAFVRP